MNTEKTIAILTCPKSTSGGVYSYVSSIYPFLSIKTELFYRGESPKIQNKTVQTLLSVLTPLLFLFKLIKCNPPYVIVNTSLDLKCIIRDGFLVLISKCFGKKVLLIVHGFQEKSLDHTFLIKNGYFRADAMIVLAKEFKSKMQRAGYRKKISTQYNPVSVDLLEDEDSLTDEARLSKIDNLLFLARIEKNKGVYTAIEAFEKIRDKAPGLNFHIAGTGNEFEKLQRKVNKNPGNHISLHGFVEGDQKKALLNTSDVLFFPTKHKEGLPINVLEAMAAGNLIITRPIGGLKDLFDVHPFGMLIESTKSDDFADALMKILSKPSLYLKTRKNNMAFARAHFHPRFIAAGIENILKST